MRQALSCDPLSTAGEVNRKRVVLLVEDEVLIRYATADHLRGAGYSVVEAGNAAEAVAVLASGTHVDIVFTDVHMPGEMDGVMLAQWINENYLGIHILVTSGRDNAARLAGVIPGGSYFPKPYTPEEVERRIRSLLDG